MHSIKASSISKKDESPLLSKLGSVVSPQSFYTPNSFYQAQQKGEKIRLSKKGGGSGEGNFRIPQHPNTITNMHIKQKQTDFVKSGIKLKQLQSCSGEFSDQKLENSGNKPTFDISGSSPFSSGHPKFQIAKTP